VIRIHTRKARGAIQPNWDKSVLLDKSDKMMTFITSSNLVECAKALDYKRLGKQRVEAYQILNTLKGHSHGWKNHPAVKMWEGHAGALGLYMNVMIDEWVARGYKNTMKKELDISNDFPWWFYWKPIHESHKASLKRKAPQEYTHFQVDDVYMKHGYIWPTKLSSFSRKQMYICEICDCL
jgi:hypothetical protein